MGTLIGVIIERESMERSADIDRGEHDTEQLPPVYCGVHLSVEN